MTLRIHCKSSFKYLVKEDTAENIAKSSRLRLKVGLGVKYLSSSSISLWIGKKTRNIRAMEDIMKI